MLSLGVVAGAGLWLYSHAPADAPGAPQPRPPAVSAGPLPQAVPAEALPGPAAAVPPPAATGIAAPPAQVPAIPAQQPGEFAVVPASVDDIRGNNPADLSIFRLAENPNIVVLDFGSLEQQGRMLDRIAALMEKKSLPRDRILTPEQLVRAIHSDSNPAPWFYYGHDYSVAELNHFFDVAARDAVPLTPEESALSRLLGQLGWRDVTTSAALISIPRIGADSNVTTNARNTILTHELSHGEYFSNPAYADYVHRFWQSALTAPERDAIRAFLAREGYDRDNPEIMENEAQAYLLFTADANFFTPHDVGMTPARRADLRNQFLRDMPLGWLKEMLAQLP